MRKLCLAGILISLFAGMAWAGPYEKYYQNLPVPMNEPMLPTIPEYTVQLTDFGGVGDGVTDNTEAFTKAISALNKKGGGHLVVTAGIFVTGPIVLKDRIDLHLERNAMILLTPDRERHLKNGKAQPGISASKRSDISITGQGIIDGNGEWWRGVKRSKVSDTEWNAYKRMGGTITPKGDLWYPFDLKAFPNVADTYEAQEKIRTHLVRFTDCERVLLRGVTLQNSPKFHFVPQRCQDVVIDGLTVRCMWNAQNGDGIDPSQCRNVLIVNNTVDVGDDGICLKGGAGAAGAKNGPCENILIQDNTVFHAHGGFVIGSEFCGGMENIIVRHNTFSGTDTGLRFKSAPERGGKTSGIRISDIYMTDIKDEAIVFQCDYADRPAGRENNQAAVSESFIPDFGDIAMERIVCRGCATGIRAQGELRMIHDITVKDATIFYNEKATDIADPQMIRLDNVRLESF